MSKAEVGAMDVSSTRSAGGSMLKRIAVSSMLGGAVQCQRPRPESLDLIKSVRCLMSFCAVYGYIAAVQ